MGAMPPIGGAIDQYAVDDIVDAYVDWAMTMLLHWRQAGLAPPIEHLAG